jgi:hexosaminidase
MKPALLSLITSFVLVLFGSAPNASGTPQSGPYALDTGVATLDIVPRPRSIQSTPGSAFTITPTTQILTTGVLAPHAAQYTYILGGATGWRFDIQEPNPKASIIQLTQDESLADRIAPEGYELEIKDGWFTVRAATAQGLFYGVQTLAQMIPPRSPHRATPYDAIQFPYESLLIQDAPRFKWRGMHLDVGRYMYGVEDIKSFLDNMAHYKFNVFHWHLTEDQGWRIEIKAYPRLTEVGSVRKSSPKYGQRRVSDETPYGGYYTQEQIKDIVAYAAILHIDVMPEIELPGHSRAAIAAYPELGNPEFIEGVEVANFWGVHRDTLNPQPSTLKFYETVFDEVISLFPFEFVHIGADEAPKNQWKESPAAQERMKELGIDNELALQAWFVAHFEKYLSDRGRRLVGWDEIQEGGLPAGATMMVWRGWHYGVEAVNKGHDIIMAPTSHTYFDYYQSAAAGEPEAIGGLLPLEKVYSFEPISEELTPEQESHVLGAQAQMWSEYLPNWEQVEYMAFPRMLALSEVVWSPREGKDWENFKGRLQHQFAILRKRGVQFRLPSAAELATPKEKAAK